MSAAPTREAAPEPGRDWMLVRHRPSRPLQGAILGYTGFEERAAQPVRRRELPSGEVVLVISFGAPFVMRDPSRPEASVQPPYGFVAGLTDTFAISESQGDIRCVQINLTPLSLYRLVGQPMSDLANRVVGLDDLFGAAGRRLAEQLDDARDWGDRFRLVDGFLASRLERSPAPAAGIEWAWRQLEVSAGGMPIRTLAEALGWSQRLLIARFREQIGLAPKVVARILRFQRALRCLEQEAEPRWAEIAYDCGYYDQAHLIRDFREFAGCTPGELVTRRLPHNGGVRDG